MSDNIRVFKLNTGEEVVGEVINLPEDGVFDSPIMLVEYPMTVEWSSMETHPNLPGIPVFNLYPLIFSGRLGWPSRIPIKAMAVLPEQVNRTVYDTYMRITASTRDQAERYSRVTTGARVNDASVEHTPKSGRKVRRVRGCGNQ